MDFTTNMVTFVDTKNHDNRSVPMTATLRTMLEGLDQSTETVLPPYEPLVLTRSFTRLTQRLGIKDLHFHDLRHDAASTLAMAGVPLRTIAAILGHRDIRMTSRYAHLTPDHLRDAMATLERRVPRMITIAAAVFQLAGTALLVWGLKLTSDMGA